MKKFFFVIVILGLLSLVVQFFVNLLIVNHETNYSIKTKDNSYLIKENFEYKDDQSFYNFMVVDQNDSVYTFSNQKDFNRQQQIIKDIKYFSTKNLHCIFPVYKRNSYVDISCIYKGQQVSYSYLKQLKNYDVDILINKLEELGYNSKIWQEEVSTTKNDTISIYKKNIPENYIFTIWFYKGVYIINEDKVLKKELLDKDSYDNHLSLLTGKYYITANVDDSVIGIEQLYSYNIKDLGKATLYLQTPVSKDIYFNGQYNNDLYFTDPVSKKQYRIDPTFETTEEVGNKEKGYKIVKDNKLITVKKEEFFKQDKVYFDDFIDNEEITKKYKDAEIRKENNFYYFKTKEGKVYKVNENNMNYPVLLFEFSNITDWKVKDSTIMVVAGDTMYIYSDELGLKPIVENRELLYNYKNICDFMKK